MKPTEETPEKEHENHVYRGTHIPWFVHVLWISFWVFAVAYTLRYVFAAIRTEWHSPP